MAAFPDLQAIAHAHPCANHRLFDYLRREKFDIKAAGALLRNYDAHASVLRRLLLKTAGIMPEAAATFILENVRTEYGAGDPQARHQLQLLDLSHKIGIGDQVFKKFRIEDGIKKFIKNVCPLYYPIKNKNPNKYCNAAVAAGAITATEILAIAEFSAAQIYFSQAGLAHHIWFDHVYIEVDHAEESQALARYFIEIGKMDDLMYGFNSLLDTNIHLYDGLLAALSNQT